MYTQKEVKVKVKVKVKGKIRQRKAFISKKVYNELYDSGKVFVCHSIKSQIFIPSKRKWENVH